MAISVLPALPRYSKFLLKVSQNSWGQGRVVTTDNRSERAILLSPQSNSLSNGKFQIASLASGVIVGGPV